MMDTQDTSVIQPGATPLGKLGTATVSTSTSATRPQSSIIQAPAIEPDDEVPATERTSTSGTGSESYHKCDICSKAFVLDFSGIVVDDPDGQHSGIQATAEPNLWTTLASSFGQDADRFVRYCSSRTFGKIWLCEGCYLCTFLDITLIDLDEWSRKGCLLSRDLFEQAKHCFKPYEQSDIESWALGIRAYFLTRPIVTFEFLQLKPRVKLELDGDLDHPTFLLTRKRVQHMGFEVMTTTRKDLYFRQFRVAEKLRSTGCVPIKPRIEIEPLSALPKARGWLDECIDSHSNCPKPGGHVPARLLSLPTSTEGPESRLYLQLAAETNDSVPFVALSYCWGGDQQLKLEKSSFDRFRATGIGIEELPRTIVDAVNVTLSLGIRHLWVDALCILQDSDEDKAREVALMGETYSAATVTLVISGASSVNDGFLCNRSLGKLGLLGFEIPVHTMPRPIPTLTDADVTGKRGGDKCRPEANIEPKRTAVFLHKTRDFTTIGGRVHDASPLYKRAWTFQERLLSPRILDFGLAQTRWWCVEHTKSKLPRHHHVDGWEYLSAELDDIAGSLRCWEVYDPRSSTSISSNTEAETEGLRQITDGDTGDHKTKMEEWEKIIREYTKRHLTYREDRLPALSTIAQCFQARTGYQYAAGLWMEDMPAGLLWVRMDLGSQHCTKVNSSNAHGQDVYCGPTWSWASVDGRVLSRMQSSGYEVSYYGKVLDLCIEIKPGGNIFGGLSSAALIFSGRLKPAFWRLDDVSSASPTSVMSESSSQSDVKRLKARGNLYTTHMKGRKQSLDQIRIGFDAYSPEFQAPASSGSVRVKQPQATQTDVYLLVISKSTWTMDPTMLLNIYRGLALQRTLCGDYTRLGTFSFRYDSQVVTGDDLAACLAIAQWLTSGDEEVIRLV